jgi:3-phosphoshikimate 1-carboxyvinyltransferase
VSDPHGGAHDFLQVTPGLPLAGTVVVPGDKSISHRALVFGALADGTSTVAGLSDGEDVTRTQAAIEALGAVVDDSNEHCKRISGGAGFPCEPQRGLDCGNSGTSMRLLAGVVAGHGWNVSLEGDRSLSARPMDRVAEPLRLMGAEVRGLTERCLPPLRVGGGPLKGIDYMPPQPSAQVKSCVLLAGLHAEGETVVREKIETRRHTEELLEHCGADFEESWVDGLHVVTVRRCGLRAFDLTVPGDPSQAAFWAVAGCVVGGSDIRISGVYVGGERRGFLDVLQRMGARIEESAPEPGESRASMGAVADLRIREAGRLSATEVDGSEITGLDEVPVLSIAAAVADGTTLFRGVSELRVKESDRLSGIVEMVEAFGASAAVHGDDLLVHGARALHPAYMDSRGDHRMAMAGAVAGMASVGTGVTVIRGWDCVATSYRGFAGDIARVGGSAS